MRLILGAPNGDSSFDLGLGPHCLFLLLSDFCDCGFKSPRDNGRIVTRLGYLGAPNSDTGFDLSLGLHCSILLALIGLTTAFSKCNSDANSTMTLASGVLSR